MKATLYVDVLCECGQIMGRGRDYKVFRCHNEECEHFGIKFLAPAYKLTSMSDAHLREQAASLATV